MCLSREITGPDCAPCVLCATELRNEHTLHLINPAALNLHPSLHTSIKMGGKKSGAAAAAAAPVEPRRRGRKRKAVSYFEESGDLDYTAIKKMKATKVVEDYEDDEFAEEAPVKPKKAGKEKVVSSVGLTIQETVEAAPAKVALLSTKKTITAAVDLTGEETGRAGPAKQVQATSKAAVAHPILPPVGEKRLKR